MHIHNDDDGTDWDVESWIEDLSDDHEIVDLIWEILSAIIRPFVRWNKSAWFYSETGNNGKGTLCALMRRLCGETAVATIPISDFGKDFMLEPLTRATAIIVDENDVGVFIDKAANLKATVTGEGSYKLPLGDGYLGGIVRDDDAACSLAGHTICTGSKKCVKRDTGTGLTRFRYSKDAEDAEAHNGSVAISAIGAGVQPAPLAAYPVADTLPPPIPGVLDRRPGAKAAAFAGACDHVVPYSGPSEGQRSAAPDGGSSPAAMMAAGQRQAGVRGVVSE